MDWQHAKVWQGDALEIIQEVSFDVLIGNLPNTVTESRLKLMPRLSFRTAILFPAPTQRVAHRAGGSCLASAQAVAMAMVVY
jgi:hypothetical protein